MSSPKPDPEVEKMLHAKREVTVVPVSRNKPNIINPLGHLIKFMDDDRPIPYVPFRIEYDNGDKVEDKQLDYDGEFNARPRNSEYTIYFGDRDGVLAKSIAYQFYKLLQLKHDIPRDKAKLIYLFQLLDYDKLIIQKAAEELKTRKRYHLDLAKELQALAPKLSQFYYGLQTLPKQ